MNALTSLGVAAAALHDRTPRAPRLDRIARLVDGGRTNFLFAILGFPERTNRRTGTSAPIFDTRLTDRCTVHITRCKAGFHINALPP